MIVNAVRVVLADDHEMVRTGLRSLVESQPGFSVIAEARDGQEACRRALELRPDVVVMDVSMPGMDGATATEHLLRQWPAARVLVLTAHDDRAHLTRLMQAGAVGYLLKRAASADLVRAITAVAAGETYVDPVLAGGMLRKVARAPDLRAAVADPLSDREEEVMRRIAWGESNKEIAGSLGISTRTVETYKARITEKLGLKSRTEMVRYALHRGWLAE
jgi:DNA-binding NarL/FixJ family response regulator